MKSGSYKDVVMIGGPNGAGKTTAAATLLPKRAADSRIRQCRRDCAPKRILRANRD
jgi:ABC-type Mn2+/Zn2+ transport system ATPase subunit